MKRNEINLTFSILLPEIATLLADLLIKDGVSGTSIRKLMMYCSILNYNSGLVFIAVKDIKKWVPKKLTGHHKTVKI